MSSRKPQAISGVSADAENVVMIVYPSVASMGLGQSLGSLYDLIPAKINGVKLSHLLFPLPFSPISLALYSYLKVFGERYVLTNRSMQKWAALGNRMISQVTLADIDRIEVRQSAGQIFYKAADLELCAADGSLLMRLEGVPRAEVFRQTILKARDAYNQVAASLSTIKARQTA